MLATTLHSHNSPPKVYPNPGKRKGKVVDQTQNDRAIGTALTEISADEKLILFQEAVCRHFQVEGCRALADPTRDVVV